MKRAAIRYVVPTFGAPEAAALGEAFKSGWIGAGVYPRLFEKRVARAAGMPFAAGINSGTAALHLALRLAGVEGGEVLTTPLTVPATSHAILYNEATPVFCDVEPETGNLDWRRLEERVTPRTRAVLVVHLNGHACDMDPILAFARERRLALIEDACASAPGDGLYKGKPLGSMGDLGCFSFSGLKNLSALDGGAVVHRRRAWEQRLSRLARLGQAVGPDGPLPPPRGVAELGYHYRISDASAVIGLRQLERWPEFSGRLEAIARRYHEGLAGLDSVAPPRDQPYARRSLHYFPVRVAGGRKAALRAALSARGVETGDWLSCNHLQALYKPYRRRLPVAERLAREFLYLPFHPRLRDAEVDRVVDAARAFARKPR